MRSDRLDWRTLNGAVPVKVSGEEAHELRRVKCELGEPLFRRLLRRLFPDQRKQERIPVPPLVGYLGSVRSTKPYQVGDVSLSGFCLLTEERWTPGTEMPVTLERAGADELEPEYFTVQATVVRCDEDGVGFSILLSESESNAAHGNSLRVRWVSRQEMALFLSRLKEHPDSPRQLGGDATVQSPERSMEMFRAPMTQPGSD